MISQINKISRNKKINEPGFVTSRASPVLCRRTLVVLAVNPRGELGFVSRSATSGNTANHKQQPNPKTNVDTVFLIHTERQRGRWGMKYSRDREREEGARILKG